MQLSRAQQQLAKLPERTVRRISNSCAHDRAGIRRFATAVADWTRVKEQWLEEKKVELQARLHDIERSLSRQIRRMRLLQAQLA